MCTVEEVAALRGLIGELSCLARKKAPDTGGRVALLQQTVPNPYVRDLIEGNQILGDLQKDPGLGIVIQPIPLSKPRAGVATDASWGNMQDQTSRTKRQRTIGRRLMCTGLGTTGNQGHSPSTRPQLLEDQIFTGSPSREPRLSKTR